MKATYIYKVSKKESYGKRGGDNYFDGRNWGPCLGGDPGP